MTPRPELSQWAKSGENDRDAAARWSAPAASAPPTRSAAVGRLEHCPGAACPFWEDGGAIVAPG